MAKTTKAGDKAQVRRLREALARERAKSAALAKERAEAREQQAASAAILKVISKSPSDTQPVFDAIVRRAMRLIGGHSVMVSRVVDGMVHVAALTSTSKAGDAALRKSFPRPLSETSPHTVAIHSRAPYVVPDTEKAARLRIRKIARARGHRSLLVVPMLRGGVAIGAISTTRKEPGPFSKRQIDLLKTFADQAVIAIENVRLFNETKEALEHQKASADILRVISGSPTDLAPVMAAIAESAAGLCEAADAHVWQREGEEMVAVASYGGLGLGRTRLRISRNAVVGRAVVDSRLIHIDDFAAIWKREFPDSKAMAEGGYRSIVAVPLVREDMAIGAILIRRKEVSPFTEKQLALLRTFADQAVIAIENVRLFNETKESLERQTATNNILRVISSSPSDLAPVFDAILENATRLCDAHLAVLNLYDGDKVRTAAQKSDNPEFAKWVIGRGAFKPTKAMVQMIAAREPNQLVDLREGAGYREGDENAVNFVELGGARSYVAVPLLKEEQVLGFIAIYRPEVRPFTEKQIDLVRAFCAQAVIAIQNVRLFNETKEALERQTATAEVLRAISTSPTDTRPVFDAILERAAKLCGAQNGILFRYADGAFHALATRIPNLEFAKLFREPRRPSPDSKNGLAQLRRLKRAVHIPDMLTDAATLENDPLRIETVRGGMRSWLGVPLLKEDELTGAIVIYRSEPQPFSPAQIALMETFAEQSVIAIENVRLFNETKESLERQTATAEILKVISSSPTDVQPVFDAIVESCTRLLACRHSTLRLIRGDRAEIVASNSTQRETADDSPMPLDDGSLPSSRAVLRREVVQIPDTFAEGVPARIKQRGEQRGFRSLMIAPLLRDNNVIGTIHVHRATPGRFTEKEVSLLGTFADQAVIAIENVRLFNETKEALERQTATAEILQVIGSSPTDTQPVFDAIVNSGVRLFPGAMVTVARPDGGTVRAAAIAHEDTPMVAGWRERFTTPLSRDRLHAAAILDARLIDFPDAEAEKDGPLGPGVRNFLLSGNRAVTIMPMLRGEGAIGAISVTRAVPGPLSDKQIAILRTFADQAVIAIENVRLFNETKESLERQTATAEILKVIASSPSDVQPVFDAIAASARRLLGGHAALVARRAGDVLDLAAFTSTGEAGDSELSRLWPSKITGRGHMGKALVSAAPAWVEDIETDPSYSEEFRAGARARGMRSAVSVPMLRDGEVIGVISVNRSIPGRFSDHQTNLLSTFADQAVIAIENVRLFNETKEALERQTATSDILSVISSSPTDIRPVLDAVASTAARLCDATDAIIQLKEGDALRFVAHHGVLPNLPIGGMRTLSRELVTGRSVLEGRQIHVHDLQAATAEYPQGSEAAKQYDYHTILATPLMRKGAAIGSIMIRRAEKRPFTDTHLALMRTFADQAVIAIDNVRLFNETKESLERQTATAEILKVIASSPSDVQPVFDTVARKSVDLCAGSFGVVTRFDGQLIHVAAISATASSIAEDRIRAAFPAPPSSRGAASRCILTREIVHMPDVTVDAEYTPDGIAKTGGIRSILAVPLMRGGAPLGSVSVARTQAAAFTPHQIALLRTFADQAVIAIENVRLFNETKESLERQTATAEILKVIAGSPTDVQPVFDAIVNSVSRLFGRKAGLRTVEPEGLRRRALSYDPTPGEFHGADVEALDARTNVGRAVLEGRALQRADTLGDDAETYGGVERAKSLAFRSIASAPLMREGKAIGVISVSSPEPGALSEKQMELLSTFADQAVIAIQNVRLFNETQEALARQEAAAQVLRSISESVSDTAPVFTAILDCCNRLIPSIDYVQVELIEGSDRVRLVDHRFGQVRGAAPGKQEERRAELMAREARHFPRPLAGSTLERALNQGRVVILADTLDGPDTPPATLVEARRWGHSYSQITVPLMREGRCIGAIEAFRRQLGGFQAKESSLLESFADQAVIAIENVRLFNETKEALERQTATAEILKVIASSPSDVQPVFDAIAQSCQKLFAGHVVSLTLVDGERIVPSAAAGMEVSDLPPWPLDRGSATGTCVLEGRTINIADVQETLDRFPRMKDLSIRLGYRSGLYVPLRRESTVIGTINVVRRTAGAFAEREIALAETFADQAVIAIENVRLFKELQQRTDALSQSVQQLTALGEVGRAVSSTLELETVLQTIAQHAVSLTGLDGASIYEYDESAEEFRLQAADRVAPGLLEAVRRKPIRKGDGTVGGTAVTREPAQVSDILDGGYHSTRKDVLIEAGYRAVLTVPLLHEDRVIGALSVTRKTPGPFGDEIVELMKTFATQSAMAIQNARLFREIAEKGKQLEEASRHKSQFLASMSHELRTPLNAILGFNEMILGDIYGEVPADMKEPLTDIQTSGKHLLRLINNVLDLAKIEAGRMELALDDYSVHDTVESVRSTLRPLAEAKGLELAVDVPPDIPLAHGDGGRITQCLMNLAGNSLKFTKQGSVGISVALENGTLTYRVKDTGIGIPADKIGGLFTEFKQTDATIASEYGGTGLGLSISKKFIEMHGGRIWAESEPGSGSTFIFEVPLRAGGARDA